MKEKIAIINPPICPIHENMLDEGCGGSETWAIQLSNEFSKEFDVYLFGDCVRHDSSLEVHYYNNSELDSVFSKNNFSHIILSRGFNGIVDLVKKHGCCDNIVIQSHDVFLVKGNILNPNDPNKQSPASWNGDIELQDPLIKKIITLSDFHEHELHVRCGIPYDKMYQIPNGVDLSLFNNKIEQKDHRILLSSADRGNDIITNYLLPEVKKMIPDFGVDVCLPSYWTEDKYKGLDGDVRYLGHLSKERLYEEMSKHCVWFYPSVFPETFCITSIEAVMCGNELILPLQYGPATTFKDFKHIGMKNTFQTNPHAAMKEASERIVAGILNYESYEKKEKRNQIYDYVKNNYSWKNIVEKYKELWRTLKN